MLKQLSDFKRVHLILPLLSIMGTGLFAAQVEMTWDPNGEDDLAGYKVYIGSASGNYNQIIDVGLNTAFVVSNLQEQVEHFFTVTAYDTAGNESGYAAGVSAVLGDAEAPTVAAVSPVSLTEIRVEFSEVVEPISAAAAANYAISPNIAIQQVIPMQDRKTVRLVTAEHKVGEPYVLTVNNVTDIALPPNAIARDTEVEYILEKQKYDHNPPTITLAALVSATQLDIYFSEAVTRESALQTSNFSIDNGIGITAAIMVAENIVRLTTSEHNTGVNYTITVNNISDLSDAANKIVDNSTYSYSYTPGDIVGPVITLVNAVSKNEIEILFNEPLDQASAAVLSNYSINNGIQITAAELDQTGQVVRLTTSDHVADQSYVLTINNVADASPNNNPIAPNTQYSYLYRQPDTIPPALKRVDVIDETHIKVTFSELLDPVSAQEPANYSIADITVFIARLDGNGDAVLLETSKHTGGRSYLLTVSHVKDASAEGNVIASNSSYTYTVGPSAGGEGPTIVEAHVSDERTVEVTFNEAVDKTSAETISNYQIDNGVSITAATLDGSGTVIRLTVSGLVSGTLYQLTVNHVTDNSAAKNPILDNSQYSFAYEGVDQTGPLVALVKTIDAENVDVLFTEAVSQKEAETISNYEISGNIRVLGATLDGSRRVVHLHTTTHVPNQIYLLRLKNIKDTSPAANEIAAGTSYSYVFEPADGVAPTIAMVRTKSSELLEIIFNEPVESAKAADPRNYQLNNNITVTAAGMGSSNFIVELNISPMDPGKVYVLLVNNILDLYGNRIAANSSYTFSYGDFVFEQGPRITSVAPVSKEQLLVEFSTPVDKVQAQNSANYIIQGGITVLYAALDSSFKKVTLQTSAHERGKIYVLIANNIGRRDDPSKLISANTPFFYLYNQSDETSPAIQEINIIGETLVEVVFSSRVDRLSSENRYNYQISPRVVVLDVQLAPEGNKVMLETSRHLAGVVYTIAISGVKSSGSPGETALIKGSFAYAYLPSLQVTLDGYAETSISFLDVGKEYYLDRNYVITKVPDNLKHVKMIMTANNDKENSDTRFMELTLNKAAFVYVAYDSRATSVANWLASKFSKTELSIGVTDKAERLELWQGYFPAGSINFGGNRAAGARDVNSMYIVLVQEPTFGNSPGGSLEETLQNGEIPQTVQLYQNYPNPFNPSTTIAFELPIEKSVRLTVFDLLGRKVQEIYNAPAATGYHQVVWDAADQFGTPVAAGVYFYVLEAWENGERNGLQFMENYLTKTGKMILLK